MLEGPFTILGQWRESSLQGTPARALPSHSSSRYSCSMQRSRCVCKESGHQNLALGHGLFEPDRGPLQPSSRSLVRLKYLPCYLPYIFFLLMRLSHWAGLTSVTTRRTIFSRLFPLTLFGSRRVVVVQWRERGRKLWLAMELGGIGGGLRMHQPL